MSLFHYDNEDCNTAVDCHYKFFITELHVATKGLVAIRNLKSLNRLLESHSYCSPTSLGRSCLYHIFHHYSLYFYSSKSFTPVIKAVLIKNIEILRSITLIEIECF